MSLIVVERESDEFFDSEVKASGETAAYLAESWQTTLDTIGESEHVPYSPDVIIRPDEKRVLVVDEDLSAEAPVVDLLLHPASNRAKVAPKAVDAEMLYLYAIVGKTKAGRVAMIKKRSPVRIAGTSFWAMARDELRAMKDDPWQLHPVFDLVVSEKGAFVLSLFAFDQICKDSDRLTENISDWIDGISSRLPMAAEQQAILIEHCEESSRLRRRLRAIAARGHLVRVDIKDVRRHLKAMGMPVGRFVKNNRLVVDEANVGELLQVLNEDLFRGGLTNDAFISEAKEARRSSK